VTADELTILLLRAMEGGFLDVAWRAWVSSKLGSEEEARVEDLMLLDVEDLLGEALTSNVLSEAIQRAQARADWDLGRRLGTLSRAARRLSR
jgi:hypothetical protein